MVEEVRQQANWLADAQLARKVTQRIKQELDLLPPRLSDETPTLISFDTHPGNFLIREDGRAVLVDLEKCRYGLPGIDLAHTSLYTSTTWDLSSQAVLSLDEVIGFYRRWQATMETSPDVRDRVEHYLSLPIIDHVHGELQCLQASL